MTRQLTEDERNTIVNGLRVAAERFGEHVKTFADDTKPAYVGLREQFQRQVDQSTELARLFEDADAITLTPCEQSAEEEN